MRKFITLTLVVLALGSASRARAQEECHGNRKNCRTSSTTGFPIASYAPETGLALGGFGVHYFRLGEAPVEARPSYLALDATYTTRNQILADALPVMWFGPSLTPTERQRVRRQLALHELRIEDRWWLFERHSLTGQFAYRLAPERFYGVGNNTLVENEETYTNNTFWEFVDVRTRVWQALMVGVRHEFQYFSPQDVDPNRMLGSGNVLGSEGGFRHGLGLSVVWDTRDNIQSAHTGSFHQASVVTFPGFLGSDYHYTHINFDARQYFRLAAHHTLAYQVFLDFNAGSVPFFQLAALGGNSRMRGYLDGRFRDNDYMMAQVEYRFMPVVWRFGLVAFAGIGEVAPRLIDFRIDELKWSVGAGVRLALDQEERIYVRLDVGCGATGCFPYVYALEAF